MSKYLEEQVDLLRWDVHFLAQQVRVQAALLASLADDETRAETSEVDLKPYTLAASTADGTKVQS